jgi:hypothetical protein
MVILLPTLGLAYAGCSGRVELAKEASDGGVRADVHASVDAPVGSTDAPSIGRDAHSGTDASVGCIIGGTYYAPNAVNPSSVCLVCDPSTSTTSWLNTADGAVCTSGSDAGAGGTCCSGVCVDELTDLNHCGACGNACTDATSPACNAGLCAYTLWSSLTTAPRFLAVDATSVYWATGYPGVVLKAPIGGGTIATLASGLGQVAPWDIAVDATNVYWTTQGPAPNDVMQVPRDGGALVTIAVAQLPVGIAVDATSVYWTDQDVGTVMKAPIGGGTAVTLYSGLLPAYIAVDGTSVYWTDTGLSAVMKVPLAGGIATTLVSAPAGSLPTVITVDATNVYWMDEELSLMTVPIDGGAPALLASGGGFGIAVDATNVYWTNVAAETLTKMPLVGGAITTLATGVFPSGGIAVDAKNVYWTEVSPSKVMQAPK